MAKLLPQSFRRILLSRLLLLSVPIIVLGVTVTYGITYRKARSALLETARQNLTESASRKAQRIEEVIAALRFNLTTLSEHPTLRNNNTPDSAFLEQLSQQLPTQVLCVQLEDIETQAVRSSTCGTEPLEAGTGKKLVEKMWSQERPSPLLTSEDIYVKVLLPDTSDPLTEDESHLSAQNSQLHLLFGVPIYDNTNQLRSILWVEAEIIKPMIIKPGILSGYPVIINQQGVILAHPLTGRVGHNIREEEDRDRLQSLLSNAIAGQQTFLHLFSFEKNGVELLAGYTAIPSPVSNQNKQKWAVLSITRLDDALASVEEIRRVLLGLLIALTVILIITTVLISLYLAQYLARPLEKLRDYTLKEDIHSQDPIPQDFNIYEVRQMAISFNKMLDQLRHRAAELAQANDLNNYRAEELEAANQQLEIANELNNNMIERLKTWAKELETAWKEAQTANQLKTEFLRITSHELRTPLNGIINSIEFAIEDLEDIKAEEMTIDWLRTAKGSAFNLLGIMDEIIDISKIESGQLSVKIESVKLSNLLEDVIAAYQEDINSKGIQLEYQQWDEELWLYADPTRLRQVLLYVVDNAVKFTKNGKIWVKTHVENYVIPDPDDPDLPSSASGQNAVITIQDSGIGIDPKEQEKLFKPFVLVDGSTTRESGGIGLGLAISRQLVELMDGKIVLSSEGQGHGTTVQFYLPLAKVSQLARETINN